MTTIPQLLTEKFLSAYDDKPQHMTELGSFVFYRTYSRWLPNKGRRETWKEAVARAVEYNVGIEYLEDIKKSLKPDVDAIREEAEQLFDNIFNLEQFLSGRTHWVGGADTGVAEKFPLANFNCSFLNIESWEDTKDLFYLLLVGTGVGFKTTKESAKGLPVIRNNVTLKHSEYKPLPKEERLENTELVELDNGYVKMYVGDSKEGWVQALGQYFDIHTKDEYKDVHTLKISYNSIRPAGERLVTFGGSASGHEPLKDMFENIKDVFQGKFAPVEDAGDDHVYIRPIHVLDVGNLIGNNVVVGGKL